ncbi:MAG: glucuronate isomerase [Clostridiales bacterium]|jgi:glucuronate isomerase|nr:glucuronate isomerase [Clostridiales bacterium]
MKKFMDENFLLSTKAAKELFSACKDEPIFDWHCHLSPKEIYENKKPNDITELWLLGDHYKWRAMRSFGISEDYITGDKSHYEKFKAWAALMPHLIGNPLYHWTHLELQRYFEIYEPLNEKTCDDIWERANNKIKQGGFTPRELIERSNVFCVCTTDDSADSLEYHIKIKKDKSFKTKILPAFRPDKALAIEAYTFLPWVLELNNTSGKTVKDYSSLIEILRERIEFFNSQGCKASDHGLTYVPFKRATANELNKIVKKAISGEKLETEEIEKYKTELLIFLGGEYAKRDWGMEIHIGAMRNNNTAMFNKIGADTGYDSVGDDLMAHNLSRLLDSLEVDGRLPKVVLFTLNPRDNYVLGSMLGNFQGTTAHSKIQFGSAWWFNDHYDGMREQMKALMSLGVFSKFIGMVTDSRSFLSYPRHEYFRRILCEILGDLVDEGKYPADMDFLSQVVKDISFNNARAYFGI